MNFDQAFYCLIKFEGGLVNDAQDPGGLTKYGISKKAYPNVDIANITIEGAKQIYRRDYWDKLNLDAFPEKIRLAMFDSAVNCGVASAIRFLQEAVGTTPDGLIGSETLRKLDAAYRVDSEYLLADIMYFRAEYYQSLPTFGRFGKGWTRRQFRVVAAS